MSAARENLSYSANVSANNLSHRFAAGTFRWVADGKYTIGQREGQKCVFKWFKKGAVFEDAFYQYDILAVETAIKIVDLFNQARIIDKPIQVNKAQVWTGINGSIKDQKFLVEPFIDDWKKFNSNSGWSSTQEPWDLVMQALSHFSYHISGGGLVLCDLQGGVLQNGAILSDPVIMSNYRLYGVTDLGSNGIVNFFAHHHCNKYCHFYWSSPNYRAKCFESIRGTTMLQLGAAAPHAPTQPFKQPMTYHNNYYYRY